jgi:small subunit ribosomal protein S20
MPTTQSAASRARSSARRHSHNRAILSKLRTLEKRYLETVSSGKREEATAALRTVCSALDKAAKTGVVKKATADRKKSRLTLRMNAA